jgi:hypothetical protein
MTGLRLCVTAIGIGFVGVLMLGGSAIVSSSEAEAKPALGRTCITRVCAVRENFVCKGPIGSCGFQQGRCLRWKLETRRVPHHRSCGGGRPVVR